MNIKKISQLAGVSQTTVSFVINNREGISEETRKKVQKVIEQEGYIPNINSRRLSMKKSFNIAFINSESYAMFSDAFANDTVKAAVRKAGDMGYSVMLLPEMNLKNRSFLTTAIGQGNVDGAIAMHDLDPSACVILEENHIPFVAIDSHNPSAPYHCVTMNYEMQAYRVCRYLIEQGHKNIAYLGIESLPDFYLRCMKGYMNALSEAHLPINPAWIMRASDDGTNVPEMAMKELVSALSDDEMPTAIFCVNDLTAIGAINGLRRRGYSVPDDVSVISIDDIASAEYFIPPLTTLHIDGAAMGEKAMEILHRIISGEDVERAYVMQPGEIMVRETVKKIG